MGLSIRIVNFDAIRYVYFFSVRIRIVDLKGNLFFVDSDMIKKTSEVAYG